MPKFLKFLLFLTLFISPLLSPAGQLPPAQAESKLEETQVLPGGDLIRKLESGKSKFVKSEIATRAVYFHQIKIGEAIVEKSFINYQFDKKTKVLLKKRAQLRPDLPKQLPPLRVTKEQAKSMVRGEAQFAKLYIISPESDVFPLDPTPENPCWIVRSLEKGLSLVTIIDAVTGKQLGYGVPPPHEGFSMSGPQWFSPCLGAWQQHFLSAHNWFQEMGHPTESSRWPSKEELRSYIENPSTTLFYELAHGHSSTFLGGCSPSGLPTAIYPSDIRTWLAGREKMSFTFIGSCGGMCSTRADTFSYEFRKGSSENAVTVGYCGMGDDICSACWTYSIDWQEALFGYMYNRDAVKISFDNALADYPVCGPPSDCMRFAGDETYQLESKRGDLNDDGEVNTEDLKLLLENFFTAVFDLNTDGTVNGLDFGEVVKVLDTT